MEGQPNLYHQHQFVSQQNLLNIDTSGVGGGDRFPQWSIQETKDFLMIRGEMDQNFMETKRNKLLWEVIATKMKEKGYNRSAEQCKCKWKNLVTRYKGCETMEAEAQRKQFPFYNELQAIFMERMLRMEVEEEEYDEDSEEEKGCNKKKRKLKGKTSSSSSNVASGNLVGNLKEILDEFMNKQMEMEMQWQKEYERREEERKIKEMEWRQKMEALQNERLMMEKRWREREEQWKMREEARAEKRDALITALLNKLRSEDTSD
ncbi:PREDICTED: trihelix transcription factor GT-3b-like [Nicotiana attenuata]|uniref:Trihelix transcription factor gt-3b n=1 Tax=Nicotiana attenuata TaxID=49451 RepID=A0A1J6HYS2_NICAT|nr:PREDICTED: trihelix transcription factor GT-3b-like [Nicotiana attenuata]OIS97997.1 trihelix transcription factor gt-3b [Nicotiana attenuata]